MFMFFFKKRTIQKQPVYLTYCAFIFNGGICLIAGLENLMQEILWCFSQVKGTIDTGVIEGKFIFSSVLGISKKVFSSANCLCNHGFVSVQRLMV